MSADSDLRRGFEFGPFKVIPERGIVRRDGEDVHLEPKQMDALVTLARHQPGVVSKDLLVEEVWGGRATADESIVQCIKGIRQALDKDDPRDPKYVETIHGRGYRLMVPLKVSEPEPAEPAGMQVPRSWLVAGAVVIIALAVFIIFRDEIETAPIDSVVVMQFENLSPEGNRADNQWVVDGFAKQLISTLYKEPDLRVLNGNLPAADESPTDIAERYGVSSVIRGDVQELDGEVRARVTVHAEDPAKQWGDDFSGTLQNMFAMHEQVADEVRSVIVGIGEEVSTPVSEPKDSEAYLLYLRGHSYLARRDPDSLRQAVELFKNSKDIDPEFGSTYLALANTYVLLADYDSAQTMFGNAVNIVTEGVANDPSIEEPAQTYIGYVQTKSNQWRAASDSFDIATGSTVKYPPAQHYYSRLLAAVGRIDDSFDAAQAAWEMDQSSQVLNSRLAIAHFWNNDMEMARRFYDTANDMESAAPIHMLSYALFLIRERRIDEARGAAKRGLAILNRDDSWVDAVFDGLAQLPETDELIVALEEFTPRNVITERALVIFLVLSGQVDQAMEMTWKLVDDPNYFEIELLYLDEFRILREHEDFPRFLDEIGLTEYWQSVGCRWENDKVECD
jgi:DNA-binding winged helix-turn-helix (wHTH) protein/TolB-like protein/tetratricopeptide (TPR) repeat protein